MTKDYKSMQIEELILLSQQKDFLALEELIKAIQNEVYATMTYLMKNNDNISDLTQEILLKIAKNIINLKEPKCFKNWKNQIIMNTYYDYIRRNKNKPDIISIDYSCSANNFSIKLEIPDKSTKPIEKCITNECTNKIKSEIRKLPEDFKIAIILREFQGLTYEEIARATHATIGTVKSRISRARLKLKTALKNYI